MTKMDCGIDIGGLQELFKSTMHESIEIMWKDSEEDLMVRFKEVLATPDDEYRPTFFTMMQMAGLIGAVLIMKYGKDENELMKMLRDGDAIFLKETKHD